MDELDVVANGYKHFRSFFTVQDGRLFAKHFDQLRIRRIGIRISIVCVHSTVLSLSFFTIFCSQKAELWMIIHVDQILLESRWTLQRFLSTSENMTGAKIWRCGR